MWLNKEQSAAIETMAQEYGWNEQPVETLGMILWALFHYYVKRLR